MICHHCGREGRFQNKQGKWLCEETANRCPVVKEKNSLGLKRAYLSGKMSNHGFTEEDRRKSSQSLERRLSSMPFEEQSWERQRNTVIAEQQNRCLHCSNTHWLGQPIKLQVDHIDGNNRNNRRDNLRALCPNCHSYTDTFCGKNINRYNRVPVPNDTIIEEIKKGLSIRQILINIGLTPKGGNYARIKKLIELHGMPKPPPKQVERKPRVKKGKHDSCPSCGQQKLRKAKSCMACSRKAYQKLDWNSVDLPKLLADNNGNFSAVGRLLGVSDNAVRKQLKKLDLLSNKG